MSVREYFENLRYALTGKRRDWQTEWNRATRDLVVPARLIVRDKHGHADAAFFERGMRSALGSARHALVTDKREGAKSVQRVYVSAGAQSYIGFLAMAYSGGLALDEIQRYVPEIVDALAYCDAEYQKLNRASEHNHVLDLPPNYQFAMMALAIFIGLRRSADEVRQLLDCTGAGGRDLLFDRVVQRRDPALVRTFLDGWYKKVYLADGGFPTHGGDAYDGYWSYEAAAVVMLWNIDDSAFREHPYYPDALVSYYRTTG